MCVDWDEGGGMGRTVLQGGEGGKEGMCERVLRMMGAGGVKGCVECYF